MNDFDNSVVVDRIVQNDFHGAVRILRKREVLGVMRAGEESPFTMKRGETWSARDVEGNSLLASWTIKLEQTRYVVPPQKDG